MVQVIGLPGARTRCGIVERKILEVRPQAMGFREIKGIGEMRELVEIVGKGREDRPDRRQPCKCQQQRHVNPRRNVPVPCGCPDRRTAFALPF